MAMLFELKQMRTESLNKAEVLVATAEREKRELSATETELFNLHMKEADGLNVKVRAIESKNTLRVNGGGAFGFDATESDSKGAGPGNRNVSPSTPRFSADYAQGFYDYVASNGQTVSAAMYEGSGSLGGYAVPIVVDSQIVPLAPTDSGVRKLATVLPTSSDIKVPRQITLSTAAAKAESGATYSSFIESEFTLDQFTLSAFMAGTLHEISWELAQDVSSFQSFAVADMLLAQTVFEENWYVNGTGVGQPQGLIGNTGVGTGVPVSPDSNGNLVSIDCTFDVLATLKGAYHNGASWLMQRSTAVSLRKAQKQANLFEPVFTRVGDQDYLHGYPVEYSTAMPAAVPGATPILFGAFRQGYVIGDRGGSGINVKVLDQPKAVQGILQLLAYRRTDGRVRRSEAIQAITLHA